MACFVRRSIFLSLCETLAPHFEVESLEATSSRKAVAETLRRNTGAPCAVVILDLSIDCSEREKLIKKIQKEVQRKQVMMMPAVLLMTNKTEHDEMNRGHEDIVRAAADDVIWKDTLKR